MKMNREIDVPMTAPVNAPARDQPHCDGAPPGWPLTLQVAVTFWLALIGTFVLASTAGTGWLILLVAIAVDYAWYLRDSRGVVVELLEDASWNRPAGTPSRYAPEESPGRRHRTKTDRHKAVRFRELNVRECLEFARGELRQAARSLRSGCESVTATRKANLARCVLAVVGLLLATLASPVFLLLGVAALVDWLLAHRWKASVGNLLFDEFTPAQPHGTVDDIAGSGGHVGFDSAAATWPRPFEAGGVAQPDPTADESNDARRHVGGHAPSPYSRHAA